MKTRREFIASIGAIVGGATVTVGPLLATSSLPGCSDNATDASADAGAGGGPTVSPSAYKFFKLVEGAASPAFVQRGDKYKLSDGSTAIHFHGSPLLSDDGRLVYEAFDKDDKLAMYETQVDFTTSPPTASAPKKILQIGDKLDSHPVIAIESVDMSANGTLAIVVELLEDAGTETEEHYRSVYIDKGSGPKRLFEPFGSDDGKHRFNGIFGDVALDDTRVLFDARFFAQEDADDSFAPSAGVLPRTTSCRPSRRCWSNATICTSERNTRSASSACSTSTATAMSPMFSPRSTRPASMATRPTTARC